MTADHSHSGPVDPAPATTTATANVRVAVHDRAVLERRWPDWSTLSTAERRKRIRATQPAPETVNHERNTTCIGLHEYLAASLDPETVGSETATHLAVGDGGATPSSGDKALTNEVYRLELANTTSSGGSLSTSAFIDTAEANGTTLREVGLCTGASGGLLLNHSLISEVEKTNEKTVSIDVTLTFDAN